MRTAPALVSAAVPLWLALAFPAPLAAIPPGVRVERDVAYGSDPMQRLDAYVPAHAVGAPIILMVHGGAWEIGDKTNERVVANKVARWTPRGIVFVSVDYRLLPEARPLEQAEDVARALAAVQSRAHAWGADPAKVVLMGHSAGAHLVALLSADPARAQRLGAKPWLGAVVLDSAALDVEGTMRRRHLPLYDRAFGARPEDWRAASPDAQLSSAARPMLVVCSERRLDGSCQAAQRFADHAGSLGVRARVLPENLTHREINEDLGLPGAYTDAVEAFLRALDPSLASRLK